MTEKGHPALGRKSYTYRCTILSFRENTVYGASEVGTKSLKRFRGILIHISTEYGKMATKDSVDSTGNIMKYRRKQ
jgi:hypothetical protein